MGRKRKASVLDLMDPRHWKVKRVDVDVGETELEEFRCERADEMNGTLICGRVNGKYVHVNKINQLIGIVESASEYPLGDVCYNEESSE